MCILQKMSRGFHIHFRIVFKFCFSNHDSRVYYYYSADEIKKFYNMYIQRKILL